MEKHIEQPPKRCRVDRSIDATHQHHLKHTHTAIGAKYTAEIEEAANKETPQLIAI